ncbi:uncharacterized protein LOC144918357 isoform X1 [Branchiostoma floridae x Branchiostoma belcheri]
METTEIIRTGAMLVAFAVAISRGRKIWMLADAGAVLLFGVAWIAVPGTLLGQMTTGPLDGHHLVMGREFGALLIGTVAIFYKIRDSGDITVSNVLLYSRVMGIAMQLMAVSYTQLYYRDLEKGGWTSEQAWFGLFGGGVWLLGNLYHSAMNDQFGCYSQRNDRLSFVLRLDGFLCLLGGLIDFAFPDMAVSMMVKLKLDGIHLHMVRCVGSVVFMTGLVSTWAPVFLKDEDKRNVLFGRIVQDVVLLAVVLPYMYMYGIFSIAFLAYGIGHMGLLVFGYLAPTGKKTA